MLWFVVGKLHDMHINHTHTMGHLLSDMWGTPLPGGTTQSYKMSHVKSNTHTIWDEMGQYTHNHTLHHMYTHYHSQLLLVHSLPTSCHIYTHTLSLSQLAHIHTLSLATVTYTHTLSDICHIYTPTICPLPHIHTHSPSVVTYTHTLSLSCHTYDLALPLS